MELDTSTVIGFAVAEATVSQDPEVLEAAELGRRLISRRATGLMPVEQDGVDTLRAVQSRLPLIDLRRAIAAGGLSPDGLPVLGLARPDGGTAMCSYNSGIYTFWPLHSRISVAFPDMSPWHRFIKTFSLVFEADVPMVPPEVRPKTWKPFHAVLFQATWRRVVPALGDPVLLRIFTRQGLAGILATWNVSAAEARAILRGGQPRARDSDFSW